MTKDSNPDTAEAKIAALVKELVDLTRDWVHDQLDGTSFAKEALDGLDDRENEVVQQLKALLLDAERKALKEFVSFVEGTDPETKIAARAIIERYNAKQKELASLQQTRQEEVSE